MNRIQIHNAIGELPEDLIGPVAKLRQRKRYPVLKWAAAAACLCLLLCLPLGRDGMFAVKTENTRNDMSLESPQENYFSDMPVDTTVSVFRAKVLKVQGSHILAEPLEGESECNSSDRFEVSLLNLEQVPEIKVGDTVMITYDGVIQGGYPCRLPGVYSIEVTE